MKFPVTHQLNGTIDCAELCPTTRYDDTINAQSTVALLQQIEQQHPADVHVYVIRDNARHQKGSI